MKNLEHKFALVEKRVQSLLDDNKMLASRVRELETELAQTRSVNVGLILPKHYFLSQEKWRQSLIMVNETLR